jgi:hypothetical protein
LPENTNPAAGVSSSRVLAYRAAELEFAGASLIVKGHAQQPVANALLSERRMTNQLTAQTLGRLRVDVPETAGARATEHRMAALHP